MLTWLALPNPSQAAISWPDAATRRRAGAEGVMSSVIGESAAVAGLVLVFVGILITTIGTYRVEPRGGPSPLSRRRLGRDRGSSAGASSEDRASPTPFPEP
jgi:hypothetical protein